MEKIRSDTCFRHMFHCGFFLVAPDAHGFVRALGNFSVMALMLVLAASEHLRKLFSGRYWIWEALIRLDVGI